MVHRSWLVASGVVIGVLLVLLFAGLLPGYHVEYATAQSPGLPQTPLQPTLPPPAFEVGPPPPPVTPVAPVASTPALNELPQTISQMMAHLQAIRTRKADLANQKRRQSGRSRRW